MTTVYTPGVRPTRRILNMVMDVALTEKAATTNEQEQDLREAYCYLDRQLSNVQERQPAVGRLAEALVTGHFPYYLGRTLSYAVLDRYNYQTGQWRDYCYMDTLPTYNDGRRFRFTEVERPVKRREKQEAYATYFQEDYYDIGVDDYAKQIDFSHRILVNDDMGAFNSIAMKMGDSARRFEDWYVSALYDNATTQAALLALGANYGGTGRLTTANLAIAWNAFLQRTDGLGYPLAISPTYLVIPPILELAANQILQSERIAELATNSINPLRNALQVRVDPYITTAAPNVPWYLFAAPSDIAAVTVVRLQGKPDGPELFAKAPDKIPMTPAGGLGAADWQLGSFVSGDIEILVEDIIGSQTYPTTYVGVTDFEGIYYSNGTTA